MLVQRRMAKQLARTVIVLGLPLLGCGSPDTGGKPQASGAPAPPAAQREPLWIEVPPAAKELWSGWQGKYVVYVPRARGIRELKDLDGKMLVVALINVDHDQIVDDAIAFTKAAGVSIALGLSNNPDVYAEGLMERDNGVGFLVPDVAKHFGFPDNPELVELRFK